MTVVAAAGSEDDEGLDVGELEDDELEGDNDKLVEEEPLEEELSPPELNPVSRNSRRYTGGRSIMSISICLTTLRSLRWAYLYIYILCQHYLISNFRIYLVVSWY